MIVVTGAAGFIGSNLILGLNARGASDVVAVDDLTDGTKFRNLAEADIADYMDKDDFIARVATGDLPKIEAVFHQGACSATTEWDGKFMMDVNYRYSKLLLHYCQTKNIPFFYASSASVYGMGSKGFRETRECEKPLNVYAYSKFLFDQHVRRLGLDAPIVKKPEKRGAAAVHRKRNSQVVGLRYFNVYGPREQHKGGMASTAFHFNNQVEKEGECRLFEGNDGYGPGGQHRDFIHVDDVVAMNLWFWDRPAKSGIFNCGTGRAQPFNDIAKSVIAWYGRGKVKYVPFPESLVGRYQSFTEADHAKLKAVGFDGKFLTVEQGVRKYLDWLHQAA